METSCILCACTATLCFESGLTHLEKIIALPNQLHIAVLNSVVDLSRHTSVSDRRLPAHRRRDNTYHLDIVSGADRSKVSCTWFPIHLSSTFGDDGFQ